MHQHRSVRTLWSLKIGAVHFILNLFLLLAGILLTAYGVFIGAQLWTYLGLGAGGLWLLSLSLFIMKSASVRCPLCMVPVLSKKRCQKHRNAKPALGFSYRTELSVSILCRGHYRCIYCGEPFDVKNAKPKII